MYLSRHATLLFVQTRLTPLLIAALQVLVLVGFIFAPIIFSQSFGIPFQGAGVLVPYLTGLIYLISGAYVFALRRNDPASRSFSIFTASAGLSVALIPAVLTRRPLAYLGAFVLTMAGAALVDLALRFPSRVPFGKVRFFRTWLAYLLVPLVLGTLFLPGASWNAAVTRLRAAIWFLALSWILLAGLAAIWMLRSRSRRVREQSRLLLWGIAASLLPVGSYLVVAQALPSPYLMLFLVVFPMAAGYALLRYRLLQADYWLSRGLIYLLLSIILAVAYGLLVSGLSLIAGGFFSPSNPILIGLIIFVFALLFNPLRIHLQALIDRVFFHSQAGYQEQLQSLGRELTQVLDLQEIYNLLRRHADQAAQPSHLHIFVKDPLSHQYAAVPAVNGSRTSNVRFSANSPLVATLSKSRDALFLEDPQDLPEGLRQEASRLALLDCSLFIPLPGRQELTGWLALGARLSGEPYHRWLVNFLERLSDQAAVAIERAQVITDLERRVRELNVLSRVAQGANFTVNFDDILELIFAQTYQIIPIVDFHVALYDPETDSLKYLFFLEENERRTEWEGKPWPASEWLEGEVVHTGRSLISDDYLRECRQRGVEPRGQTFYAWMGVPLNAGSANIGVISLASRSSATFYTPEQGNLLQAIADQAAGSIVKARLLQESEARAHQLATLNELGRSLTSTLELEPLLNEILENATRMLNCQAGSLFLVDEGTEELVFEVVLGPVASELRGERLPPGSGIVGEVVRSGEAIIANGAQHRKGWYQQADKQTGFETQDILAAPLKIKDKAIGVIELINKDDFSPFTRSDRDLLATFASQASIAIENARLYTLTDQALAARVEELSVMQHIDRELNASLEINRALTITLSWAMRQSRADAGLIGMVEPQGLRVMAAEGFGPEIEIYLEPRMEPANNGNGNGSRAGRAESEVRTLPVEAGSLQMALESARPQVVQSPSPSSLAEAPPGMLLPGARSQLVVPIHREKQGIGILLLESRRADGFPEELVLFLSRLSDHAAIAIANARLYGEVEAANLAKSKFVSFVAHELKNPMASIKGYTELVSGGMAGPVNEMQSSFLATVCANVDRMNTIVSDLNDLTKIQVGSLRLEYQAVTVQEVISDSLRSLQRQLEEKGHTLVLQIPEDLPLVWADPLRMGQILINLVSNAHKYSPKNTQIVVGADRRVGAGESPGGLDVVHFWVKDDGIGIAEEDQRHIFEQYFRTEASKEIAAGTGLGLNITRSLVEMQGGRIWFESQAGSGTTFHFTLPASEAA